MSTLRCLLLAAAPLTLLAAAVSQSTSSERHTDEQALIPSADQALANQLHKDEHAVRSDELSTQHTR